MTDAQKMILTSGPIASRLQKVYNVGAQTGTGTAQQVVDVTASAPTNAIRAQLVPMGTPGARKIWLSYPGWVQAPGGFPATVDFDFANNRYYQQGQTAPLSSLVQPVNRGITSYAQWKNTNWTSFAPTALRVTDLGILIEEQRTNSIRNSACQGAVVGAPGSLPTNWSWSSTDTGITSQITATGTDNAIDYVEIRYHGTTVAASGSQNITIFFDATPAAAASGQTWTSSCFYKLVAGSLTNISNLILYMYGTQAGAGIDPGSTVIQPSAAGPNWSRVNCTYKLVQAAVDGVLNMVVFQTTGSPVAIDFTVRFGWPQLEQNPSVSSPIRTTGTALTRQADIVTMTTPPVFGSALSLYAEGIPTVPANFPNRQFILEPNDGSAANRVILSREPASGYASGYSFSNFSASVMGNTGLWGNSSGRVAIATSPSSVATVFNGGAPSTDTPYYPLTLNNVGIGRADDNTQIWNGYVSRISIWPKTQLSVSALQQLTAAPSADVDFDFANNVYSFTGNKLTAASALMAFNSAGYADDTSGNWIFFPANTPRITNKGLLVEEVRTNSLANNAFQGGVVGTPGTYPTNWVQSQNSGLNANVVGFGTDTNGVDYVDLRLVGTTVGGQLNNILAYSPSVGISGWIPCANGQTWAGTAFIKLQAGSMANISTLVVQAITYDSALATQPEVFSGANIVPTSAWARYSVVGTLAQAASAYIQFNIGIVSSPVGAALDLTLRIGWPQLERITISNGTFSSPIRTTNAAVTRSGDNIQVANQTLSVMSSSIWMSGVPMAPFNYGASQVGISLDDNAGYGLHQIYRNVTNAAATNVVFVGTAATANLAAQVWGTGNPAKLMSSAAANDFAVSFNGNAVVAQASGGYPTLSTTHIGEWMPPSYTVNWNGYITRMMLWLNYRIPNAQMQLLTETPAVSLGPVYKLNFVTQTYTPPLTMTCSRNSVGYAVNSSGVWTQFAVNTPRITDLGLLVEQAITNQIRNNSMQGAVVGTPGTLPTRWTSSGASGIVPQVVAVGTDAKGIDYIDLRFAGGSGNTSLSPEASNFIAAANGQNWTFSAFYMMVAGSLNNVSSLQLGANENNSSGTGLVNHQGAVALPTASWQRGSLSATFSNASTAFVGPFIQLQGSGAIDITLRVGWPQAEQVLGFATSPIRTAGVQVARQSDNCLVSLAGVPIGVAQAAVGRGTALASTNFNGHQGLFCWDNGTTANRALLFRSGVNGQPVVYMNSSSLGTQSTLAGGPWPQNTSGKMSGSWAFQNYGGAYNGVNGICQATGGGGQWPPAAGLTQLSIGQGANNQQLWNGYVTSLDFYPACSACLSVSQLNNLTSADLVTVGTLAVNTEGWSAALTIVGKTGGAIAVGTRGAPGLALTVSSKSWTAAGVQTTLTRTVWATAAERQPYPNQTLRSEVQSGANVVIQLALSSMIYAGDTITGVNVAAGFFTDNGSGGSGSANVAGVCTFSNVSNQAYLAPIGMWLNHDRDWATSSSYTVSFTCAHRHFQQGQTVRAVKFVAADQHANTSSIVVSAMTKLTFPGSGLSCSAFTGAIDLTPLTQGDMLTVDVVVYPWIGDAWQASVNGVTYPSPNLTTLQVLNDKAGTYGTAYAYVDGVGAAPAVSANPATAATTPYANVVNAAAALKTFINTNYGRNNISGGIIRLTAFNHIIGDMHLSNTGPIPLIIEAANPANKATTVLRDSGVNLFGGIPAYLKLRNIKLQATAANVAFLDNNATINSNSAIIIDSCTFDNGGNTIGNAWVYQAGQLTVMNCDGNDCKVTTQYSPAAAKMANCWGNVYPANMQTAVFNACGCKDLTGFYSFGSQNGATGGTAWQGGVRPFLGWCFISNPTNGNNLVAGNNSGGTTQPSEFAIIGCVLEQYGGSVAPALAAYNDSDTSVVTNYIDIANTVVGARNNSLYQDTGTTFISKIGMSALSVFQDQYCKTDVFATNGNCTGNWDFRYRVDGFYRAAIADLNGMEIPGPSAWIAEIYATGDQSGSQATPLAVHWTSDQSCAPGGTSTGNGNYRPLVASTVLNQIPAGMTAFPFDLNGTAVPTNGTAYVGALQP